MRTPAPATPGTPTEVLTVSQLNRLARSLLEECFPGVWVEGEISNLSRPSSGHWYFTLKDGGAQVRCAMFRNRNIHVRFQPAEGQKVLVRGSISLYEARGDYQLIAEQIQPAGAGLLALQFEQLKQKLQAEGLFDAGRKRALPRQPHHIAIITSPTGAAIRDILTVLKRRAPAIRVTVIPVVVQGEQAAPAIARAIAVANQLAERGRADFDLILTGRGGGSLEDLWAFNDERVARAIAASRLPVVSAVGHETDTTIADLVADVRAPTPSAAAELVSPDQRAQMRTLQQWQQRLLQRWRHHQQQAQHRLENLTRRLHAQHPGRQLQQRALRLDELEQRLGKAIARNLRDQQRRLQLLHSRLMARHPGRAVEALRGRLLLCERQLPQLVRRILQRERQRLQGAVALLQSVSPLNTLARGYAIVSDAGGRVVRESTQVAIGTALSARLWRGRLDLTVTAIHHATEPPTPDEE
jgi:exodeoxyribonuclease VII large subunit